jgi:hypothetical protein
MRYEIEADQGFSLMDLLQEFERLEFKALGRVKMAMCRRTGGHDELVGVVLQYGGWCGQPHELDPGGYPGGGIVAD